MPAREFAGCVVSIALAIDRVKRGIRVRDCIGFYGHLSACDHLVSFAANFHIAKFRGQVDLMGF